MFIATFDINMVRNWNKHIFLYLIPAGAKNTKILKKKKQAELLLKSYHIPLLDCLLTPLQNFDPLINV